MNSSFRMHKLITPFLIVLLGIMAPVLYWISFGNRSAVTVNEVKKCLVKNPDKVILIDIRTKQEFREKHIANSRNWPFEEVMKVSTKEEIPDEYKGRKLFMLCESGFRSVSAVNKLNDLGIEDAKGVMGGYQAWLSSAGMPGDNDLDRVISTAREKDVNYYRESPRYEQWAAVLTGFVVKPIYMLISLVLIIVLWRSRSHDLAVLRWALIFFLTGESFCAINYLIFNDGSYLSEYLHSFGMILCFGLAIYAFFEGMDMRFIKFSEPEKKCAALGLCRECIKYEDVPDRKSVV